MVQSYEQSHSGETGMRFFDSRSQFKHFLVKELHCKLSDQDDAVLLWRKYQNGQVLFTKRKKKAIGVVSISVIKVITAGKTLRLTAELRGFEYPEAGARRALLEVFGPCDEGFELESTCIRHEPVRRLPEYFGMPVQRNIAYFKARARNHAPIELPLAA